MNLINSPRVLVEKILPEINYGEFPVKRVSGETVTVRAHVYADGHDALTVQLLHRRKKDKVWQRTPMKALGNDEWQAGFLVAEPVDYLYTVRAWINSYATAAWSAGKKQAAGQDFAAEAGVCLEFIKKRSRLPGAPEGPELARFVKKIETEKKPAAKAAILLDPLLAELAALRPEKETLGVYPKELRVCVERERARFSSWYEIFPRSFSDKPGAHGTFRDCERLLPEIADLGFDVLYFPPIHPIGETKRKGKNNSVAAGPGDPGSPWAIGSALGGHKAVDPRLGTLGDFDNLVKKAKKHGIDIALDIAFQCSPDHPYIKEHPQWFKWRPDGTIQHAENPPKKYEDVVPVNFDTVDRKALWEELKSVFVFWAARGVSVFRVDNPHTKPFPFWQWVIAEVRKQYPDAIFLAEAFTKPKVMYRLAKAGFTQSYTYFTWRNTKPELTAYLTELTRTGVSEYFRPNFWPNTPDILSEIFQRDGRPAFLSRLVLAGTLSSNYGMYGPAYEQCVNAAVAGKEEYLNSEKYEIKNWDLNAPGNLRLLIKKLNAARRQNPALQATNNIRFLPVDNDAIIAYVKASRDGSNVIITVVNLDGRHRRSGWLNLPLAELGLAADKPYKVHDLLTGAAYSWSGERNYVELDPGSMPAHVFRLEGHQPRVQAFDYYS
ncbi:MAG: hypothetical protein A2234_10535 [Elusimicrobia bacterium RIFOXYA2_FULL_58_8]|nr:MAG: hypothetical protein A2285_09685 [Elusimicrobia bacterium RIFOXYA12_FULL_57_11]OGS14851.1 MAG: hypothetical protein A2234_10535 [Elusimicrobia bacterium RIFOXYA2_FULL_58_8]